MTLSSYKKIAFFMPSFGAGGAERVAINVANALAGVGYKVDFVVLRATGEFSSLVSSDVKIVALDKSRILFSIFKLSKYFRSEKPTVVISFMHYVNVAAIVAKLLSFSSIKLVVTEHSLMSESETSNSRLASKIIKLLCMFLYERANAVIAVSDVVRDYLVNALGIPREKIHKINNPVNLAEIRAKSLLPNTHPWYADDSIPIVLSVGRLSREKNFALLIRAFMAVRKNLRARLVILGEGPERKKLEEIIQSGCNPEDCLLLGFQENPYNWMARANLFVSSSDSEAFGNVLVESLACNTKVVTTLNSGAPLEILETAKWGTIVDNGNINALAEAIKQGLVSTSRGDLYVRAANFDIAFIVREYRRLIEALTEFDVDTAR